MDRKIGLSSARAFANAASPHAYQSTGLSACWIKYGLRSSASRFIRRSYSGAAGRHVAEVHREVESRVMSSGGGAIGKRVALLIEEEFEDREVTGTRDALQQAGITVTVVGPSAGARYRGKKGEVVAADLAAGAARAKDFDAIVIPGGHAPDRMRGRHFLRPPSPQPRVRRRELHPVQQNDRLRVDPREKDDDSRDGSIDPREARHVVHVPRESRKDALPDESGDERTDPDVPKPHLRVGHEVIHQPDDQDEERRRRMLNGEAAQDEQSRKLTDEPREKRRGHELRRAD